MIAFGVVVGCSSPSTKEDVGNAPFDLDQIDAKEDSPTKPSKGADARVAEQITDQFSGSRGFIAHQIHLAGGTVDINVSGLEGSDQLDTIVWVYGPKKANGKYSTPAIAFNDDANSADFSSHVAMTVPAEGDYLVVVSTYENYVYFPNHVSRGQYQLAVKCQSEGFGACGPAVSGIDGQCWADTDCVAAADGEPLHCEGEVVCAPNTACFFTRVGTCVEDYVWMTIAPKQCTNPWSATPVDASEQATFPVGDLAQVKKHYGKQGVSFDELGQLTPAEPVFHCQACGCGRGDQLIVKVKSESAGALASDGWVFSAAEPEAVSLAPKQCGSNPWQTTQTSSVAEELELVDSYFTAEGAVVPTRGFSYPAEPTAVCASCACGRGDRLIAFPKDQESAGVLGALGFGAIYVR